MHSSKTVTLFIQCLVDTIYPEVAHATVQVFRRMGIAVICPTDQTCCGQPAFNSGYKAEGQAVARRFLEVYERTGSDAIVLPSGSCTAMIRHLPRWFDDPDEQARARAIAERTYELSHFLVEGLGREQFSVFDEGDRQEIVTFAGGNVPFTAALMIDASAI